ncbi:monooxygenase [Pediococcus siamensis]|uniref:monooxygenase n=1 Tax=Pediococcus siamensis TaxID=381829 RepID=UPI00399F768A
MLKKISSTFGSWPVLKQIEKNNPNRQFITLSNTSIHNDFQLLDVSGQDPVFANPLNYFVKFHHGNYVWNGFYRFAFMTLSEEEIKVLNAKVAQLASRNQMPMGLNDFFVLQPEKRPNERVLLTTWQLDSDYAIWRRSASYEPFKIYSDSGAYNYHDANYTAYRLHSLPS